MSSTQKQRGLVFLLNTRSERSMSTCLRRTTCDRVTESCLLVYDDGRIKITWLSSLIKSHLLRFHWASLCLSRLVEQTHDLVLAHPEIEEQLKLKVSGVGPFSLVI